MKVDSLDLDQITQTMKLLGDKTRLRILRLLEEQECCVCELTGIFQASQPSISQHLRKLKDAGLVKENRKGKWIFYSINTESSQYPMVRELLTLIPSQRYELEELEKQGLRISCE